MSKCFRISIISLILFQTTFSQSSTTSPKSVENVHPIPQAYTDFFRFFGNQSEREPFISKDGFTKLIRNLQLVKRSNGTKSYRNMSVECHSPKAMMKWFNKSNGLSQKDFLNVCPSLLLQIVSKACRPPITITTTHKPKKEENNNSLEVWLYSFGAVFVISAVGLVVVWLIPIMPKQYYNGISQLLIALAVGSLTGDALLHLIPRALFDEGKGGHSHGSSGSTHSQTIWKSLVALIGIHLFFLTERITILLQNHQSKRRLKIKQKSSQEHFYSEISVGDKIEDSDNAAGKSSEKKNFPTGKLHWASKSRKYSENSKDNDQASTHIGIESEANNGAHLCNRPKSKPHVNSDCPDSMNFDLCNTTNLYSMNRESNGFNANNVEKPQINGEIKNQNFEESKNSPLISDQLPGSNNNLNFSHMHRNSDWSNNEDRRLLQQQTPKDGNINNSDIKIIVPKDVRENEKIEIGAGGATVKSSLAHPYKNKPHGHHHGHSHDLSSLKAIAYTVIAGDGLHNFCDGIAIGAAFAKDFNGGLSTAIAVLCHELPHELGDFVVLLHAGMSLRTAIFYNLVSSVFCLIGMIIGVCLGNMESMSSWIFMLTAGMFLYIALVDMMPELSTRRLKGKKTVHRPSVLFIWQNIGFIIGSAIMLVIALYE